LNAKEVIKISLKSTGDMLGQYLADFSDQDMLVHPVPAANNAAWQVGHLIAVEASMSEMLPGATYPELPAGLKAYADGKTAKSTPPGGYLKKAEYVDLFNKVRSATIANVDRLSDADLDKPTPGDFAAWAPTLGDLLVLTANHTLMHAGQFSVTRRALSKPVLF
jgi:hypothetical protein